MREADARAKWCPFVHYKTYPEREIITSAETVRGGVCIAGDCMMWRKEYDAVLGNDNGYCGLAGRERATGA